MALMSNTSDDKYIQTPKNIINLTTGKVTPKTTTTVTPKKTTVTQKPVVKTTATVVKNTAKPVTTAPTTTPVTTPTATPDYTPAAVSLRSGADLASLYGITYDPSVIQAKFDTATRAEYEQLRKEYDATANKFYGQMYGTQNTALDTIRKSNAQAVATGASRGVQAANELSAILGLEQTNNMTATDLANQRNQLVDKEGAAYAKNALDAFNSAQSASEALATLGSNIYAADTQNNVGEMNYYASMNQAAKALEGTKYTADSNLTGTKYASDANIKAAGISAQATRDAASISGQYSVKAAQEANKAQTAYYDYMKSQSTGNTQSDYITGMNYLQKQYDTYMKGQDYENAAIWYSKLTGLDYNTALRNIRNSAAVKADLAAVAKQDATQNSAYIQNRTYTFRGYPVLMP